MKLTKQVIDEVKGKEGFPLAKDEDILALSDSPFYTACPNPFIEEFMKNNGKPYNEMTDTYHREPFATDVSEGKYDPLYRLHSYPTKVPHKAIMRYILHYTEPGDIVFDGFCGTGMTGIAAQTCQNPDYEFKHILEKEQPNIKWGARKAILCDLSPTATFIANNYNKPIDVDAFSSTAKSIIAECENELGWMFETNHNIDEQKTSLFDTIENKTGRINYTVWSRVFICPNCLSEFTIWDASVNYDFIKGIGKVDKELRCKTCNGIFKITDLETSKNMYFDNIINSPYTSIKQVPVLINYTYDGKRFEKVPDEEDLKRIQQIYDYNIPSFVPKKKIPFMHQTHQRNNLKALGIEYEYQLFTKRSLIIYSYLFDKALYLDNDIKERFMFLLTSCFNRTTRLVRYMAQHKEKNVGPLSGTLYFPPIFGEINVIDNVLTKIDKMINAYNRSNVSSFSKENVLISTQSSAGINIPSNSVDYIFIDPPFGDNLMYSELNYFTDMWLKVYENNKEEAIINKAQNKTISEYQMVIQSCFNNMYRCLKPNRWITIEFHNSQNAVWNSIQESLQIAGFIIADVRTLDKKKGTTKQMSYTMAVKQDLVISAYKPRESFKREFIAHAGSEQTAWDFVRQHLEQLPVVVIKNDRIEINAERQAFLLFDRMVAYHIMNGISVPLDASDFYKGLEDRFLKRDNMYFLHDQVNEYDTARIKSDIESVQMAFLVSDEKSAIEWLYQQLVTHQSYAEIQPKFMQEVRSIAKYEKLPELSVLLEENFLLNEEGKWYIPDVTKSADVIKLREKRLIKEFEEYLNNTGKLKLFRTEAIRAGFAKLWKDKNYELIVKTAERLPDKVIQEDDKLLMYYDISLSRI
ncbi:DNA methyltransferase [Bacillus sp. JJ1562]|uniref:DNA methyltransferase n=1 Tax=Bacillus sp. JJ1562 TaxID=3122960 RepID=UPI003002876A